MFYFFCWREKKIFPFKKKKNMENSVTSLSIDPSRIFLLPWIEIDKRFEFTKVLSDNVFATLDFAVKVIPSSDRTLSNELAVSKKLNLLSEENAENGSDPRAWPGGTGFFTSIPSASPVGFNRFRVRGVL